MTAMKGDICQKLDGLKYLMMNALCVASNFLSQTTITSYLSMTLITIDLLAL
jgi:hypothetical protein